MRKLMFCALTLLVLLSSCAITRPSITQLVTEPPLFMVKEPLKYSTKDRRYSIVVPVGFVSDLASIPRAAWAWQSPHEATMAPAIIHDYLYWEQSCTKDEADAVMYLAMDELSVRGVDAIYLAIRTPFADGAWARNKRDREKGENRFFTPAYAAGLARGDIDPKATWASIHAAAVKSNGFSKPPLSNSKTKEACIAALHAFSARQAQ